MATNRRPRVARLDAYPIVERFRDARGVLLLTGVLCQCITVWITWPLWQVRADVPNLGPVNQLPIPFGPLMMLSAVSVLMVPRFGIGAHWLVLVTASLMDQYRLQPQFFFNALLITACISVRVKVVTKWLIASTWLWAGLHKLLSPDWFGHASHWLVGRTGLDADRWYIAIAVTVAIAELVLGLAACLRPRWAALLAVPTHCGIILFLLWIDWNASVIPWNVLMASTGVWTMWTVDNDVIRRGWQRAIAVICLAYPVGFYGGWVDHGFAGVLYSDWLPSGQITTRNGLHFIDGWGALNVPFPSERRLLRLYFERYAEPGDKLHIADPRRALEDQFFVLDTQGRAREIGKDAFFIPQDRIPGIGGRSGTTVAGIGIDQRRAVFTLSAAGVRMVRPKADESIFAVEFRPENYDARLLRSLEGLPNLMQVQLAGTSVTDEDLGQLVRLRLLTGLGLRDTRITDEGIRPLADLPFLQYIEHEGTSISEAVLNEVLKSPVSP